MIYDRAIEKRTAYHEKLAGQTPGKTGDQDPEGGPSEGLRPSGVSKISPRFSEEQGRIVNHTGFNATSTELEKSRRLWHRSSM
jgi:hypothetical protein